MTEEEKAIVIDIRDSLNHLNQVVKEHNVPDPALTILTSTISALVRKTNYLLLEDDA